MRKMTYTFFTVEELVSFVGKAEKCSFDIKVISNHMVFDGKSLMGIMVVGIGKPVEIVCYNTEFSPEELVSHAA